jgi:hypothetical protein
MSSSKRRSNPQYQESAKNFDFKSCRRGLNREKHIPGASTSVSVVSNNGKNQIEGRVEDHTPFALAVTFEHFDKFLRIAGEGFKLNFKYGGKTVFEHENPKIIRVANDKSLAVFSIGTEGRENKQRLATRFVTSDNFTPTVSASDPLKIDEFFHFKVKDISATGFAGQTSLANKHLFKNLVFDEATFHFPAIGTTTCSFQIVNFHEYDRHLIFGAKFIKPNKGFMESLIRFFFFNLDMDASFIEKTVNSIREQFQIKKEYKQSLRLSHVQTKSDFDNVLKLRLSAYQNDREELSNAGFEDMTDPFDERSFIVTAKLGRSLVGTLRLVYVQNSAERFPMEDLIELPDYITNNRKDYLEISKLAIDPFARGSDVRLRLFQKSASETVPVFKGNICLSTSKNEMYYRLTGATKITESIPHPYIKNETLAAYLYRTEDFLKGTKMSANAWFAIGQVVTDHLAHWDAISPISTPLKHKILKPIEDIYLSYLNNKAKKLKKSEK